MFCGTKIVADQALGGRSFLDFRDQAEAASGLGFERRAETTRRLSGGGPAIEIVQRGESLSRGYFIALGGTDFSELVHCRGAYAGHSDPCR
jgi:hypothetical protein